MAAYARLQRQEFAREADGYTATRHQRKDGAGYFDEAALAVSSRAASTMAMAGFTGVEQFG